MELYFKLLNLTNNKKVYQKAREEKITKILISFAKTDTLNSK
jgi:hypothetical protein